MRLFSLKITFQIGSYKYNDDSLREIANKSIFSWTQIWGLYIATLGVADEVRRFGIGTQLIKRAIEYATEKKEQLEIAYLNVITYNNAAIKFYEKNDFKWFGTYKDYYMIGDNSYDSYIFFKRIRSQAKVSKRRNRTKNWNLFDWISLKLFGPELQEEEEQLSEADLEA